MVNEFRLFGPPGTGKTTRLGQYAKRGVELYGDGAVLMASFTKGAASEIAGRFTGKSYTESGIHRENIGTLHSFAYRALERPTIAETLGESWNAFAQDEGHEEYAIKGSSKSGGFLDELPAERETEMGGDKMLAAYNILRARMIPQDEWPLEIMPFVNLWERFKSESDCIDFTDMITYCVNDVEKAPGDPKLVLLDEVQDMTPLNLRLGRKWGSKAEKLVMAGDDDQCIYGFIGATPNSFLYPALPSENKEVLEQSHRLPRAVHSYCQRFTRALRQREPKEYLPRNLEGEVRRLPARFIRPEKAVQDAEQYIKQGKSVMFLASCSYMLRPLIAVLKQSGIPFHNPYRKTRGDWNPIQARAHGISTIQRLLAFVRSNPKAWPPNPDTGEVNIRDWNGWDMKAWAELLRARDVFLHGGKARIEELSDGPVNWLALLDELFEEEAKGPIFEQDYHWLVEHAKKLYQPRLEFPVNIVDKRGWKYLHKAPQVIVGTIHSVKGGEADVVYVWPDLSMAGADAYAIEDPDSVNRLLYVACTRAKETLVLLQASSKRAVRW